MENSEKRLGWGQAQGPATVPPEGQKFGPLDAEEKGEGWYVQVPVSYAYTQYLVSRMAPQLWQLTGVSVKKCLGHAGFERGSVVFLNLNTTSFTQLHRDPCNTLLLVVAGTRTVWVAAPPEYTVDTGAYSLEGVSALPDNLNPASPECDTPWKGKEPVVLRPGDAILFPRHWWHVVQGEARSVALGIELRDDLRPLQKVIKNVGSTRSPMGWACALDVLRIMGSQQLVFPVEHPKLVSAVQTRSAQPLLVAEE